MAGERFELELEWVGVGLYSIVWGHGDGVAVEELL